MIFIKKYLGLFEIIKVQVVRCSSYPELTVLLRVTNFDIKRKKTGNICFIICHQQQARSGKIKVDKTQQVSVTTQVFFVKTELQHIQLQLLVNNFILLLLIFFSEIINP